MGLSIKPSMVIPLLPFGLILVVILSTFVLASNPFKFLHDFICTPLSFPTLSSIFKRYPLLCISPPQRLRND